MRTPADLPDMEDAVARALQRAADTVTSAPAYALGAARAARTTRRRRGWLTAGRQPLTALAAALIILAVAIGSARLGREFGTPRPAHSTQEPAGHGCESQQELGVPPQLHFTVRTSLGACFTGSSLVGKRVVLYSFAVTQPTSMSNAAALTSLARLLGAEGITFVAVALPGDTAEEIRAFEDARDITGFPTLVDSDAAVANALHLLQENELCYLRPDGTSTAEDAGDIDVSSVVRRAATLTAP